MIVPSFIIRPGPQAFTEERRNSGSSRPQRKRFALTPKTAQVDLRLRHALEAGSTAHGSLSLTPTRSARSARSVRAPARRRCFSPCFSRSSLRLQNETKTRQNGAFCAL